MQHLKLGENKRPFQITFRVLSLWQSETKKSFQDMENITLEDMAVLTYHGLRSGFKAETGTEPTFTRDQFNEWIDDPQAMSALAVVQKELESSVGQMLEDPDQEKSLKKSDSE